MDRYGWSKNGMEKSDGGPYYHAADVQELIEKILKEYEDLCWEASYESGDSEEYRRKSKEKIDSYRNELHISNPGQ
jgi:hypothetical protein